MGEGGGVGGGVGNAHAFKPPYSNASKKGKGKTAK